MSLAGDQVSLVALPLVAVVALHAGPGAMGVLTAAGWLPSLLFSLHAGAWVDRSGRRREAMIAADLGRAALLVSVPAAWALGALSFVQLAAVAFAIGTLACISSVAGSSLYAALVPQRRLVEAGALLNGSRAAASVAGPSVGGALVGLVTAPVTLLADAASFLASAAWLRRVRVPAPEPDAATAGHGEGARFIARSALIRPILAATATLNLFTFAFLALFVLYATRALHIAPGLLGAVLGAGAVGAVLGSLVTRRIASVVGVGPAFVAGCALFPAPLLLVPLAGHVPSAAPLLLFAAEFGSGFGVMVLDISAGAVLAAAVPDPLRARVAGAYQLVNYGVRPLGALAGGALGARLGLQPTLWLAATGALASVLWLPRAPVMRLRALPEAG